jgi:hypothetical protein
MARRIVRRVLRLCVVLAAIAFGYLAGLLQGQKQMMRMLQTEAAGNLTQRVETLSLLRLGDVSKAIANLEQEADQLTLGIAGNQGADRRVLLTAKAYRSVVPPPMSRASDLAAVFDPLPTPKPSECGSALQLLLKSGASFDK